MTAVADHQYMSRALQLAQRGLFTTGPNPRVGCVLVRDGRVVGEGWHVRAGEPHAEINALAAAGAQAQGATAYVTLEPCSHHGRTPPCCEALVEAGIARVVYAMQDPNPQVAGQGAAALQAAGVEVSVGVLADASAALNPGFIKRMRTGLPWVRCKLAMSLDGRTAMASGESRWITGTAARADVQRLRARAGAVVTGIDTVLHDDPSMNVRLGDVAVEQPVRVVLDTTLRMPVDAKMIGMPGRTLVVTGHEVSDRINALLDAGAEVTVLPMQDDHLSPAAILEYLGAREVNEVHLESGATLCGAFLQAGLVDELVVYLAPHLMGDAARGLFSLPGLDSMDQRIGLDIQDIRAVGEDWRITARVREKT